MSFLNKTIAERDTIYLPMHLADATSDGAAALTLTAGGWNSPTLHLLGETCNNDTKTHSAWWELQLPNHLFRTSDINTSIGEASGDENLTITVQAELTGTPATSATIDFECFELDGAGSGGSDLVSTGAQSMLPNGTASAEYSFTVTGTGGLTRGKKLLVRTRIVLNDSGGAGGGTVHLTRSRLAPPVRGW